MNGQDIYSTLFCKSRTIRRFQNTNTPKSHLIMKSKIKFCRRKFVIPIKSGEVALYYSNLMYAIYENPYCWLHFSGGEKYMVEVSVTELLKNLPIKPFFQCNRTDIINLCYYGSYEEEPSMVVLEDGTKFSLSIRRKPDFKKKKAELKRISPLCHPSSDSKNERCPDFGLFCSDSDRKEQI